VDPAEFFGRAAPLVLDLGCGNGLFLGSLAAREPQCNFLGVERKRYRVVQSLRRSGQVSHARVVHGEISEVLRGLPRGCVSRAYVLFNDPWPKRRHAVRRLVQREFADLLASRLEPAGAVFFASDSAEYAAWSGDVFMRAGWGIAAWVVPPDWPETEFGRRFALEGKTVHRFQARPDAASPNETA
jgi:tRNA (guanine-N7-)-methyltransferase